MDDCRDAGIGGWMDWCRDVGVDVWMNRGMDGWVDEGMDRLVRTRRTLPLKLMCLRQDPQVKSTGWCNEMSRVLINKRVLSDEPSSVPVSSTVSLFPLSPSITGFILVNTHITSARYKICWFLRWDNNSLRTFCGLARWTAACANKLSLFFTSAT